MILGLRTSDPTCQMFLISDKNAISQKNWLAERRLSKELLGELEIFLGENNTSFEKLTGLIVFRGPGSYTGLRIGISVVNALAYGLNIPIIGETGDNWLSLSQKRLQKNNNDTIVIPEYGGLPHITQAKK
jgi:tRNA threonylcarbamoyladenosine biosynthesis protein TsaB